MKFKSIEGAKMVLAKDAEDGISCYCDDCRDATYFINEQFSKRFKVIFQEVTEESD